MQGREGLGARLLKVYYEPNCNTPVTAYKIPFASGRELHVWGFVGCNNLKM